MVQSSPQMYMIFSFLAEWVAVLGHVYLYSFTLSSGLSCYNYATNLHKPNLSQLTSYLCKPIYQLQDLYSIIKPHKKRSQPNFSPIFQQNLIGRKILKAYFGRLKRCLILDVWASNQDLFTCILQYYSH